MIRVIDGDGLGIPEDRIEAAGFDISKQPQTIFSADKNITNWLQTGNGHVIICP